MTEALRIVIGSDGAGFDYKQIVIRAVTAHDSYSVERGEYESTGSC